MSDKTWYEHLDEEDLDGKHVQVTLADGTVLSGRLTVRDDYPDVALLSTALVLPYEDGTKADWPIGVMCQTEDPRWLPFEGVSDISLVWDERDWVQIGLDEVDRFAKDTYAIVVNGHLHVIDWCSEDTCCFNLIGTEGTVDAGDLSFALRRRGTLPTIPGFYKDRYGNEWMLDHEDQWVQLRPWGEPVAKSDPRDSMPMTRGYFCDGRA